MKKDTYVEFLLRIGIALAFIYPPVSALFNPYSWVGYFPVFVSNRGFDMIVLLHIFGAVEMLIALWILFGKRIFIPSAIASFILAAIVVFNLNQMDVLFRDISILLMSIALALLHRKTETT